MDYCREYKKETLYTILREKCRTRGGCTALEYRDVTYSWDELDKLSGLTADDLFRLGAGPGDHIGIIGMNSANWVIALFAICRLGAVAVLLNYSLKASELMLAVDTADINYLCYGDGTVFSGEEDFSRDPCLKRASEKLRGMLCISDRAGLRKRMDEAARCRDTYCYDAGYDSPSFILFTSGSSGVPKGVQLTPFGVINNADIVGEMLGLTENDSLCLALPLFHSFGLTCGLITSLLYNNVVHIPDSFHRNDLLQ